MMNVSEYASDVGVTVKEILELCNKLDIKVSKEDDMLSDDDIIILDNELASIQPSEESTEELEELEELEDIEESYEEQIKDYLGNQKSIKEDMEEVIKIIALEKEILVFLKDNQNSWSLQNKNIYFTDQNVEREYYLLINKFSESEESVDL